MLLMYQHIVRFATYKTKFIKISKNFDLRCVSVGFKNVKASKLQEFLTK